MFQTKTVISCKEPMKISHPEWFTFGLTHFAPKKTFIVAYCQQVFKPNSFKGPFWPPCQPQNFKIHNFFLLTLSVY